MDFLLHGAGHPFLWLYGTLANLSGHPIGVMKLLALAGIAVGAISLLGFTLRLRIFSTFEAAVFTFLVWSYAEFHNWATKLTATYLFSLALLCLGLNLLAIVLSSDKPRLELRIASLLAIFCSFSLNSLIVAYYVGLGVALLLISGASGDADGWKAWLRRSRIGRVADFIAIPVVYWFSTNYFFPKIGPYTGYYHIRLPRLEDMIAGLTSFWRLGFARIPGEARIFAKEAMWPALLALVIAAALVAVLARQDRDNAAPPSARTIIWPFLAAAVAFAGFASPYLVSGISPTDHFYECRHLVLFGIPLGLGAIGVCRASRAIFHTDRAAWLAAALILAVNLCSLWSGYFLQQARWLRQEAMIDELQVAYQEPPAAVFNLADGFLGTTDHTYYGMTEMTGALHAAWDARPLFAFTGQHEGPTILQDIDAALKTEGSAFRNMDPRGVQATIALVPKPPILSSTRLAMSYYYHCLISSCDRQAMLRSLADTTVMVGPIPHLSTKWQ
ncbi:hypothetical protein UP06_06440 [Bradyrhizobium sp. LTSP857]|nr:hypothetical protein UP06_06440 [Bradyrhizobium sp. LTSP857]